MLAIPLSMGVMVMMPQIPDAVPLSISMPQTVLTSRVTGMLYSVPTPLSCVGKEYTHVYSACCVLICRRF
jgi:hypothetical protein